MKKIRTLLLFVMMFSVLTGCAALSSITGGTTKTFDLGELTIDAPKTMSDQTGTSDFESFDFALADLGSAIVGIFEDYDGFEDGAATTLEDYAEMIVYYNDMDSEIQTRPGKDYLYVIYEATVDGTDFKYLGGMYKTDEGFWFIQMYTAASDFDEDTILGYLDTVTFK